VKSAFPAPCLRHCTLRRLFAAPTYLDCGRRQKRGGIAELCAQAGALAQQTLHQVPDGHAARNGVRVDNNVRRNAKGCEGHVLVPVLDATGSLLPVA